METDPILGTEEEISNEEDSEINIKLLFDNGASADKTLKSWVRTTLKCSDMTTAQKAFLDSTQDEVQSKLLNAKLGVNIFIKAQQDALSTLKIYLPPDQITLREPTAKSYGVNGVFFFALNSQEVGPTGQGIKVLCPKCGGDRKVGWTSRWCVPDYSGASSS
ncbi:hypothetical protein HDU93_004212 [Gonapodya sp. JEL0774]|nr:hypothetical protein HDU93_004212 [Gonapodya sp. JEL0774]